MYKRYRQDPKQKFFTKTISAPVALSSQNYKSDRNSVVITRSEVVMRLNLNTSPADLDTATCIPLIPTYDATDHVEGFSWVSGIAMRYQLYRWLSLKFEWVPSCSSSNNAQVILAYIPDPADRILAHGGELMDSTSYSAGPAWAPLKLEWSPVNQKYKWMFTAHTRENILPTNANVRNMVTGRFYAGFLGPANNPSFSGRVICHYTVQFKLPQNMILITNTDAPTDNPAMQITNRDGEGVPHETVVQIPYTNLFTGLGNLLPPVVPRPSTSINNQGNPRTRPMMPPDTLTYDQTTKKLRIKKPGTYKMLVSGTGKKNTPAIVNEEPYQRSYINPILRAVGTLALPTFKYLLGGYSGYGENKHNPVTDTLFKFARSAQIIQGPYLDGGGNEVDIELDTEINLVLQHNYVDKDGVSHEEDMTDFTIMDIQIDFEQTHDGEDVIQQTDVSLPHLQAMDTLDEASWFCPYYGATLKAKSPPTAITSEYGDVFLFLVSAPLPVWQDVLSYPKALQARTSYATDKLGQDWLTHNIGGVEHSITALTVQGPGRYEIQVQYYFERKTFNGPDSWHIKNWMGYQGTCSKFIWNGSSTMLYTGTCDIGGWQRADCSFSLEAGQSIKLACILYRETTGGDFWLSEPEFSNHKLYVQRLPLDYEQPFTVNWS